MKKIRFQILLLAFLVFSGLILLGCDGKKEIENKLNNEIDYEFERKMIVYDLGNNVTEEIEIYIDKQNDTVGYQKFTYNDKVLDSSKSRFYTLHFEKTAGTNKYDGIISYHFNPNEDGKLSSINFTVISKTDKKTDFLSFDKYDSEKNQLEFEFENKSDTLMGVIYAQHSKDTIENGEDKVRIREIVLIVDNYTKTNNPFVKGITLE